ncbi:MAG: UDP-2,3-diacylglucosamine diphosphatase [Gammaproteobacteria bacterium]|nr:UDP-2,3-diacylglucosamine diphosphatase [Gammaproteobacteria bacterium]
MTADVSETLFISDLHLTAERPAIIELFSRFVNERAVKADALYILGDFFEYWVGDDDPADELAAVFGAFNNLHDHHVPVYFMHGNRDFLIKKDFEKRTHCQLIQDPTTININQRDILLMHGDSLCTDDIKYQQFKTQVRSHEWQKTFTSKPLSERKLIVENLRKTSQSETSEKNDDIMDVNKQAVNEIVQAHRVNWLIHGHTHRPDIHCFTVDNQPVTRIVLGDWYDHGSVLSVKSHPLSDGFEFELENFQ